MSVRSRAMPAHCVVSEGTNLNLVDLLSKGGADSFLTSTKQLCPMQPAPQVRASQNLLVKQDSQFTVLAPRLDVLCFSDRSRTIRPHLVIDFCIRRESLQSFGQLLHGPLICHSFHPVAQLELCTFWTRGSDGRESSRKQRRESRVGKLSDPVPSFAHKCRSPRARLARHEHCPEPVQSNSQPRRNRD